MQTTKNKATPKIVFSGLDRLVSIDLDELDETEQFIDKQILMSQSEIEAHKTALEFKS